MTSRPIHPNRTGSHRSANLPLADRSCAYGRQRTRPPAAAAPPPVRKEPPTTPLERTSPATVTRAAVEHISHQRTQRGRPPGAGSRAAPSGPRSDPPAPLPHRVLDPEDHPAFEHITLHHQLGVLLAQPHQLGPLILAQRPVTPYGGGPALPSSPASPRSTQIPGDLRDRLAGLLTPAGPHLPEATIELPPRLSQRRPS